jgi:hypothetical protein
VHNARAQENNTHIGHVTSCHINTWLLFHQTPLLTFSSLFAGAVWYAIALVTQQTQGFPSDRLLQLGPEFAMSTMRFNCLLDAAALQTAGNFWTKPCEVWCACAAICKYVVLVMYLLQPLSHNYQMFCLVPVMCWNTWNCEICVVTCITNSQNAQRRS